MNKEITLLKSEIKKAQKLANKVNNATDCTVTGYFWQYEHLDGIEDGTFAKVRCEICHNYEKRADEDVMLSIFIPDRRRSFAYRCY